ncbi:MAG: SAF domain-containing protein [Kiritimatiellia bacterium]
MKNVIPLIVAVVLGLVAVLAVNRTLAKSDKGHSGNKIVVLVANGNLKSGHVVGKESFRSVEVPLAYAPKQHVLGDQRMSIVGQMLTRDVAAGDYIQWNDLGQSRGTGESVGEGEWAVSVGFQNADLVKMLKPGDEIAIVGMFDVAVEKAAKSADVDAEKTIEHKKVTTVLFPQMRIMELTDAGTVLFSVPPQQAMTLLAAQEQATLYAALRRPHDEKATNRKDSGVFDGTAFAKMLSGCPEITIPDKPFNKIK